MHNRLLTNASRRAKEMTFLDRCPRCRNEAEIYLLRDCPQSMEIWDTWIPAPLRPRWQGTDQNEWLEMNLTHKRNVYNYQLDWPSVFATLWWHIWKSRNENVFEGKRRIFLDHLCIIKTLLQEAELINTQKNRLQLRQETLIGWDEPPTNWVKLNVDGSALGNPGASAAGRVCRENEGNWLFGISIKIGMGTAYQAEVFALWQLPPISVGKGLRTSLGGNWLNDGASPGFKTNRRSSALGSHRPKV